MICTKPAVVLTGRYNQAETARALGLSRQTVRKYEVLGLLRFKLSRPDMRKVTTGAEIVRFWEKCVK